MAIVEKIEYFDSCPSCGAPHDGSGVCSYCGCSMVKSKEVTEVELSEEDLILEEDRGIPVVKGKSGEVSSFMKLFCPLFGGIFVGVPTFLFITFAAVGMPVLFMLPFFALFWVVGIGALVPLFRALSANKRCKNGTRLQGVVRGYANSSYTINGSPAQIIRVLVEEDSPTIIEISTGDNRREYAVGTKVTLLTDGTAYLVEGATA